jgi:hypothetical protein
MKNIDLLATTNPYPHPDLPESISFNSLICTAIAI